MYIPEYKLKTLQSAKSLQLEVERRTLKHALAEARRAVEFHNKPPTDRVLTLRETNAYTRQLDRVRLDKYQVPQFLDGSPERALHEISLEYHFTTLPKYKREHEKLKQDLSKAREAYNAFLARNKPSDLE
jgi:hypothetical protein